MAERRSPFSDYLIYLAVCLVVCLIQSLPFEVACKLAESLAWVIYRIDGRHRRVADDNLRHAFGDALTDKQRDKLIREVYRHFCRLLIEIIHLPRRLQIHNWRRH